MADGELGDPALIERQQRRGRGGVERDRLAVGGRQRARVEQVALHEQGEVLERDPGQRRGLDQRLGLALLVGRGLVRDLCSAALLQVAIGEHRGRDLAARDIDHRGGLAAGEADRVEYEHVALE
jgi:hypothetical protein